MTHRPDSVQHFLASSISLSQRNSPHVQSAVRFKQTGQYCN